VQGALARAARRDREPHLEDAAARPSRQRDAQGPRVTVDREAAPVRAHDRRHRGGNVASGDPKQPLDVRASLPSSLAEKTTAV